MDLYRQPTRQPGLDLAKLNMLSATSVSSIDKRRQQHRRQQSLETPILVNPLPANPRQRAQAQHRRGLSLDQSLMTLPINIVPVPQTQMQDMQQQEIQQYQGRQKVSIPNGADSQLQHSPEAQHILQETQQQRSQPGQDALDFAQHLQQQLNGMGTPNLDAAAEAKQQLQQHISWFQATYGEAAPNMTSAASPAVIPLITHQAMAQLPLTPTQQHMSLPYQAIIPGHSHTVPNTPQRTYNVSSPVQTAVKHERSQSFQYDATPLSAIPLADIFGATPTIHVQRAATITEEDLKDYTSFGAEQSYASSAYSSSIADPMSPPATYGLMPTVPEEDVADGLLTGPDSLLTAAAGVVDDCRAEHLLLAPEPYSPRQAALMSLGDINASIEETGVSSEQVNQYMSEQNEKDSKWTCLYPECGKKFGRKENIRAHVQTHLGDRQFKCNDCGKCFVRQHDLKRHAKIHSGIKPNICPCGMSFARQDALTRHRQRGTCFGVLPGYEKNDDERKKRGRPRKERPDLETRIEKAARARQMAATRAGAEMKNEHFGMDHSSVYAGSASSDSGASDHSSPLTPAPSSDIDDMLFNDFVATDTDSDYVPFAIPSDGTWMIDTPPTSPASYHTLPKTVAPTMLSNHASPACSSPVSMDDVESALLAWRGDEAGVY